jgi:hypothetical protein
LSISIIRLPRQLQKPSMSASGPWFGLSGRSAAVRRFSGRRFAWKCGVVAAVVDIATVSDGCYRGETWEMAGVTPKTYRVMIIPYGLKKEHAHKVVEKSSFRDFFFCFCKGVFLFFFLLLVIGFFIVFGKGGHCGGIPIGGQAELTSQLGAAV